CSMRSKEASAPSRSIANLSSNGYADRPGEGISTPDPPLLHRQGFSWTGSHSPFEFERLKSAAVTRLLLDEGADVVCDDGASSGWTDGDDTRSADVAGIARGRPSETDPGRADANRQRAAGPQGERRATRRQLEGAARTARSETAAGRMRRRRTHE